MGWFSFLSKSKTEVNISVDPNIMERHRQLELEQLASVADSLSLGRQLRQQMVKDVLSSKRTDRPKND